MTSVTLAVILVTLAVICNGEIAVSVMGYHEVKYRLDLIYSEYRMQQGHIVQNAVTDG